MMACQEGGMSTTLETRPNVKAVRSYTATSTPPISIITVPGSRVDSLGCGADRSASVLAPSAER